MKEVLKLRNQMQIPTIGFGTYKSTQSRDVKEFEDAIQAGYRYFDTASFYGTEEKLGNALKASGLPRESFQVASKVWKDEMGYENTLNACKESLKRLQMDYLDVYLVHWPKADKNDENWKAKLWDTWNAIQECYEAGLVKAVGVSNFLPHHLDVIMGKAKIQPMINQIEFHPGYIQEEAVLYSQKNDIVVQAWSPLGRTRLFQDTLLVELAEKYQVSVAQICLRFAIQQQIMPLPKSTTYERMKENLNVFHFEIQEEDMERIRKMPQTGWSGEHPDRERVKFL